MENKERLIKFCRKGPQENASNTPGVYYLNQDQWMIGQTFK